MNNSADNVRAVPENARTTKRSVRKGVPKRKMIVELVSGVDRPFLVTVILLLCMGTIMVFSSSYPYAREYYNDSYKFARMQVVFAISGIVVMALVARFVHYRLIRRFSKAVMIVGVLMLVAVLLVGSDAKGAVRWLQIGPITIQPSEIMKFAVVLFFADYADKYHDKIKSRDNLLPNIKRLFIAGVCLVVGAAAFFLIDVKAVGVIFFLVALGFMVYVISPINLKKELPGVYYGILPYIAVLGVVGFLLYKQPHLSGLIIIAAIMFFMMIIGGTKAGYLLFGAGVGIVGVIFLATTLSHSSARLMVWKDPFAYFKGDGWQPAQSLYAIGSGGFWGVGFGNSRQKHLFLPEPQNDYIFSILCEEMGFIGAFTVICVFVFFIYRGITIGLRAPDRFSSMLVIGIIMHVGLQVILNIAVVTNSLPSTGISLPFFSYGGTSLMILLAEMGVVLSVSKLTAVEKTS